MVKTTIHKIRKISFIGGMCTGKTTLLKQYEDKPGIKTVKDSARDYLQINPELDRSSISTHKQLAEEILQCEQITNTPNDNIIICDGSILTVVAHAVAYKNQDSANYLLKKYSFWLPSYENFFLLNPKDIPYITDAVRTETEEFREVLHNAFLKLLVDLHLPYKLLSGTVKERMLQVNKYLGI